MNLPAIKISPKTGNEPFHFNHEELNLKLSEFWSWSQSDILGNTLRGVLAEFIVMKDLGIKNPVRSEWDAYDLITKNGTKIEVKSSAYLQSWKQTKLSNISFGISPTMGWDSENNEYFPEIKRQSDFYVFCLLHHKDKNTVDPTNLNQWKFYVLPTKVLNEKTPNQKNINLNSLLKLNPIECSFGEIKNVIK